MRALDTIDEEIMRQVVEQWVSALEQHLSWGHCMSCDMWCIDLWHNHPIYKK